MSREEPSNSQTIGLIVIISAISALILAILATALQSTQQEAKELDRSLQMLIAAKIYDVPKASFVLPGGELAKLSETGVLVATDKPDSPSRDDILTLYNKRLPPRLVDAEGNITTFEEAKINLNEYIASFKKTGYYKQPYKLIYEILSNDETQKDPIGYIIPINGFGLWDAIYGYLAIKTDGITVIGISWYEQKETPGLGANITEPEWQNLFPGKKIFQPSGDGSVDPKTSPLGINVVKGKVSEVFAANPKADNAVDGMSGATLTGNGVKNAYKDVLEGYRPFFVKLNESFKSESTKDGTKKTP